MSSHTFRSPQTRVPVSLEEMREKANGHYLRLISCQRGVCLVEANGHLWEINIRSSVGFITLPSREVVASMKGKGADTFRKDWAEVEFILHSIQGLA